ncbi:HET-domain-containing protein [Lophiostoma macrostomum CBS 122681]|uniref:HET-domain-containing protein n=1 Tax=Lophiostoma macrostomum CBS 122681 TaxID=1314788 RepID=A0A6A6TTE6_9PLEO|nr:HET-domain-containing protein [Lophiostoma macrostomum CBS 122681]
MPLSKPTGSSQRSVTGSSTYRKRCRTCNNLDPRGHAMTVHQTEGAKEAKATLTLVLDPLSLSRTKLPSDGGCRYCALLKSALDTFFEGWRNIRQKILMDLKEKASINVSIEAEKWGHEAVEIYARSASRAPWPSLGTAHRIPDNSGSDDTFDFARRCIQDCITNPKHAACKGSAKSSSTTPRRLLDVGRVGAPIRLIDTMGRAFEYVCLSHCWGSPSTHTLTATKSNWRRLASNISFEMFPPLFQDAVVITRQLGLRYLWIDSLCIIQDSVRDWDTESLKMSGIYEHAYVTISATNSSDSNTRCLIDRRKAVIIPYSNTTGKEFAIRARKVQQHHPSVEAGEPARPRGPLTTRAWVLQEHVLSTRILHYTATELLFECKTSYCCECLPTRRLYSTTPSLIPKAILKREKSNQGIWDVWQRLVEEYSRRTLTVTTDKLPAISGIASKIQEATQSAFIAGLWKDNLASDLLWSSTSIGGQICAPATFRAPSFSWASIDGPISYYESELEEREHFNPAISLLSSSITLCGLNSLGAISNGSIKIRGPCLSALLSSSVRDGKWQYALLIKGTSTIEVTPDSLLVEGEVSSGRAKGETTVTRASSVSSATQFRTAVKCLSIAGSDNLIWGLVLGVSPRIPGSWERLGTFAAGLEVFQRAKEDMIQIT